MTSNWFGSDDSAGRATLRANPKRKAFVRRAVLHAYDARCRTGKALVPELPAMQPHPAFLGWHREHCFKH